MGAGAATDGVFPDRRGLWRERNVFAGVVGLCIARLWAAWDGDGRGTRRPSVLCCLPCVRFCRVCHLRGLTRAFCRIASSLQAVGELRHGLGVVDTTLSISMMGRGLGEMSPVVARVDAVSLIAVRVGDGRGGIYAVEHREDYRRVHGSGGFRLTVSEAGWLATWVGGSLRPRFRKRVSYRRIRAR